MRVLNHHTAASGTSCFRAEAEPIKAEAGHQIGWRCLGCGTPFALTAPQVKRKRRALPVSVSGRPVLAAVTYMPESSPFSMMRHVNGFTLRSGWTRFQQFVMSMSIGRRRTRIRPTTR